MLYEIQLKFNLYNFLGALANKSFCTCQCLKQPLAVMNNRSDNLAASCSTATSSFWAFTWPTEQSASHLLVSRAARNTALTVCQALVRKDMNLEVSHWVRSKGQCPSLPPFYLNRNANRKRSTEIKAWALGSLQVWAQWEQLWTFPVIEAHRAGKPIRQNRFKANCMRQIPLDCIQKPCLK